MIRGITPIDGAFELIGLHQAQALMRFIFLASMAGKLIFTLGFMLSIKSGLEKGNLRTAFIFLMIFFSLLILLVVPRAKVVDPISAMERNGYQDITTVQVLRKNGYNELVVSPVLDMASRAIDSLVTASSAVLERGASVRGYLASPFLFVKVSVLTSSIVAHGITDPQLEERVVHFYQDHFWPAVKISGASRDGLWPGAPDVVAAYKEKGRAEWQSLREALYQVCDRDQIFSRMFERFYDGKPDKDSVVRSFLAQETALKPSRYALMTYASGSERRRATRVGRGFTRWDILFPQRVMPVLPFMQGIILWFAWSSLPAFLVIALLFRSISPILIFTSVLVSVKGWTLIWAVLDKVSTVWSSVDKTWGGLSMWEGPVLNVSIALAAVVLPLVLTAGAIFWGGRVKVEGKI